MPAHRGFKALAKGHFERQLPLPLVCADGKGERGNWDVCSEGRARAGVHLHLAMDDGRSNGGTEDIQYFHFATLPQLVTAAARGCIRGARCDDE
jgi:hypothetical protein